MQRIAGLVRPRAACALAGGRAAVQPVRPLAAVFRGYADAVHVDDSREYNPRELFPPAGAYVPSNTAPGDVTKRPTPLNVEMLQYKPLQHPVVYGDKVAEVMFASFNGTKDLELFVDFALRAAFYAGIPVRVAPLPRKIKRWTVIKSPFAMAKTKENWERITTRRVLRLYDTNPETVQVFLSVLRKHTLAGVGVKAKLFARESVAAVEQMDVPTLADAANPLAVNKVDLRTADGDVARAVMELLRDPAFAPDAGTEVEGETPPVAPADAAPTQAQAKKTKS